MKLLVINGSPNGAKGGTAATCDVLISAIQKKTDATVQQIYLADVSQPYCDGCLRCLKEGGEHCPVLDKVAPIEQAIRDCDAFVLASPVHSFAVGAMVKTMIDLLVKEVHRPSLFGKKAVVVATAFGGGQHGVLKYMRNTLAMWGVDVVAKFGSSSAQIGKPAYDQRLVEAADKVADKLIASVKAGENPSPAVVDLIGFQIMRVAIKASGDTTPLDTDYWTKNGWLDADYFTDAKLNPFKNMMAKFIGRMVEKGIKKGKSKPIVSV